MYWLLYELHVQWGPLNVFRYITFRAALAILTVSLLAAAFDRLPLPDGPAAHREHAPIADMELAHFEHCAHARPPR